VSAPGAGTKTGGPDFDWPGTDRLRQFPVRSSDRLENALVAKIVPTAFAVRPKPTAWRAIGRRALSRLP